MSVTIRVNDEAHDVDVESDTPMLWVIRDIIGLTGTKFGCGIAMCGACTVHVDGDAKRSCVLPIAEVGAKNVLTIEQLSKTRAGRALQRAWRELDVVQCGYCQSGQLMSAAALLTANPTPTDADIDEVMAGNLCRCGTYGRIRAGVHLGAKYLAGPETSP